MDNQNDKFSTGLWEGETQNGKWRLAGTLSGEWKDKFIKLLQDNNEVYIQVLLPDERKSGRSPTHTLFATPKHTGRITTPPSNPPVQQAQSQQEAPYVEDDIPF